MVGISAHVGNGEEVVILLKIKNLSKFYQRRQVLENINLHIFPGEIYGLLGRNGAGKTTLINIICNLLRPDHGTVTINNLPTGNATTALIGIAPQDNLLYEHLTCAENLDFFATIYGLTPPQKQQRIRHCLESVNLADRAKSLVKTLSGGMKRRLNIAVALVHQPKLIILDEPTAGLDVEARSQIWDLINQLPQQGITVLLTTHLLDEAEGLCHRLGILKDGQLLIEGNLAELKATIPAVAVLIMQTPTENLAIARAQDLGFCHRRYGQDLGFWLPEVKSLSEIVNLFSDIEITSISLQPLRLEHIYLELTSV